MNTTMHSQPTTHMRYWARVQAVSGLTFSLFAVLHLLNTALAALGPARYDGFQRALRPYYQYPAVELALILVPLVVHVVAGIVRMRDRKQPRTAWALRTRIHRYSGYFLLTFIFGHIAATRLPALLHGAHPEFSGVAFTFQFLPGWFYPYYTALALAGLLHLALGIPLALGALGVQVPRSLRRGAAYGWPVGVAAAAILAGVAGLGGLLYAVPDMAAHPFAVQVREVAATQFGIGLRD